MMISKSPSEQLIEQVWLAGKAAQALGSVIDECSDEMLTALYQEVIGLEEIGLIMRAAIAARLVSRHARRPNRLDAAAVKGVAKLFNQSPQTIKELIWIWQHILSKLEPGEFLYLPVRFYQEALRARRHGIAPIDAARYAAHVRNVINPHYTREEFRQDISNGLPPPEEKFSQKTMPTCAACVYLTTATGDVMLTLTRETNVLASGIGEGTRYCEKRRLLRHALGDLFQRAKSCEFFIRRGGMT